MHRVVHMLLVAQWVTEQVAEHVTVSVKHFSEEGAALQGGAALCIE